MLFDKLTPSNHSGKLPKYRFYISWFHLLGPSTQLFRSAFLLDNKWKLKKTHLRFLNNIFTVCCTTFGTNYIKIIENFISSNSKYGQSYVKGVLKSFDSFRSANFWPFSAGPNHYFTLIFMTQLFLQCHFTPQLAIWGIKHGELNLEGV